ncbi:MAG TPA: single-stranded DNA-binding protein [Streptosporangiaceae bacterium]|nr:single-stranded DNA-binding protein [Streptosporangiaceae bacterium]
MANEATFSVSGYVATQPKGGWTRDGTRTVFMRLGWTPRRIDKTTGEWTDQPSSFVSVICYRRVAENAALCLRRGDPVVVKGTLRVREYGEENGPKRTAVEVIADTIGHDLSRGITIFKKSTEQLEKTAAEREQEVAAAARQAWPGDRGAIESEDRQPDGGYPVSGDLDMADGAEFDEEEARQMLADAAEAPEVIDAEPMAVDPIAAGEIAAGEIGAGEIGAEPVGAAT